MSGFLLEDILNLSHKIGYGNIKNELATIGIWPANELKTLHLAMHWNFVCIDCAIEGISPAIWLYLVPARWNQSHEFVEPSCCVLRLARTYVLWWPENTRACRGLLKKDVASKQKVKFTDKEKMFGSPFWKSMAHWWWLVTDFSPVTQDIHIAMELAKGWCRATPLPSRRQKSSTASSSETYAAGSNPRRFCFSVSFFIKTCEINRPICANWAVAESCQRMVVSSGLYAMFYRMG